MVAIASGENLDDAGDRVGPVQHARGTAYDLNAIDIRDGEMCNVNRTTCIIHRHTIDEHLGVVALAAAQKNRCLRAERAGLYDRRAGNIAKRVSKASDPTRAKLLSCYDGNRRRRRATVD